MGGLAQVPRDKNKNPFLSAVSLVSLDSQSQAAGATPVTLFKSQGGLVMNAQAGDSPANFDARVLTIVVGNNATAQTITGLSLAMSGKTASGLTGTITYAITQDVTGAAVSIAEGATQTFVVVLSKGKLPTLSLTPTFGAAPAAGDVECYTVAESSGSPLSALSGSNAQVGAPPVGAFVLADPSFTNRNVATTASSGFDGIPSSFVGLYTAALRGGFNGGSWDGVRVSNGAAHKATGVLAAAGSLTIWTPASAKRFRLLWIVLNANAATTLHLQDGATGFIDATFGGAAAVVLKLPENGYFSLTANNALSLTSDAAATVWATAIGTEE